MRLGQWVQLYPEPSGAFYSFGAQARNWPAEAADEGVVMEDLTQEVVLLQSSSYEGPWIVEVGNTASTATCVLRKGERVVLGSGGMADLRLDDPTVSARHCEICAGRDGLELRDLGSKNGVYVGAARVERAWLRGDPAVVVVGSSTIVVRPETEDIPGEVEPLPGLVGGSGPMRRVVQEIRRHARLRAPVLLQGESGTGKDLVARALHALSGRRGAYVALNACAIPDGLADAELFGHRRGAFTGAVGSRAGAFEQAHRGTLFLDEIADLGLAVQAKLLRVVEDGQVRPVGASTPSQTDVRVVSASWARLSERVALGLFRADLYHRLSTLVVVLPPLRARKSDIPLLCETLLSQCASELGPKHLSSPALARLVAHHWSGNVRELGNVLYRAAVRAPGMRIEAEHITLTTAIAPAKCRLGPAEAERLLATHQGNVSAAARAAHVPRSTFRSWLRRVS